MVCALSRWTRHGTCSLRLRRITDTRSAVTNSSLCRPDSGVHGRSKICITCTRLFLMVVGLGLGSRIREWFFGANSLTVNRQIRTWNSVQSKTWHHRVICRNLSLAVMKLPNSALHGAHTSLLQCSEILAHGSESDLCEPLLALQFAEFDSNIVHWIEAKHSLWFSATLPQLFSLFHGRVHHHLLVCLSHLCFRWLLSVIEVVVFRF